MPALSVTVLNYNYGCYLATCLEVILAQEEEHADDMADLLVTFDPKKSA